MSDEVKITLFIILASTMSGLGLSMLTQKPIVAVVMSAVIAPLIVVFAVFHFLKNKEHR